MDELHLSLIYIKWAVFAAVGGAVGYLLRSTSINARSFMIETVGASFMGALVSMGCQAYGLSTPLTGALVGLSALAGARATLGAMESLIKRRLHIADDSTTDETHG